MNYYEAYELKDKYIPSALYTIIEITQKGKKFNPVHDELINKTAYPLYLKEGERGYVCVDTDKDGCYHLLYTSSIEKATPWEMEPAEVTIETKNTVYTLKRIG